MNTRTPGRPRLNLSKTEKQLRRREQYRRSKQKQRKREYEQALDIIKQLTLGE